MKFEKPSTWIHAPNDFILFVTPTLISRKCFCFLAADKAIRMTNHVFADCSNNCTKHAATSCDRDICACHDGFVGNNGRCTEFAFCKKVRLKSYCSNLWSFPVLDIWGKSLWVNIVSFHHSVPLLLSAVVCPYWPSIFLREVHKLCGAIPGSHFLSHWLRTSLYWAFDGPFSHLSTVPTCFSVIKQLTFTQISSSLAVGHRAVRHFMMYW